jgi:signal transduction histidine kinase
MRLGWQPLRRSHPLAVALLIVPLSAVSALAAMATLPAVFNAAIRVPLKQLAAIAALAVAGTAIFPALYPEVDGRGYGWQLTVGLLLTAVALGWGLFVRAQRELFTGLRERGQEQAREAERQRIAREMHDVSRTASRSSASTPAPWRTRATGCRRSTPRPRG